MKFSNILVSFDKSEHAVHTLEIAKDLTEKDPVIQHTSSTSSSSRRHRPPSA